MAHFHIHTLPEGTETSAPVIDPENEDLHWHTVDGVRTSSNGPLGGDHTHTIDGETTSPPIDRDSNKGDNMSRETKVIGGNVIEVKQIERNGVKIGIVKGYIATWDLDRGSWGLRDRFIPGAFLESILDHQAKGRQIRLKDHHDRTIGGFPPATVREDEIGLFGEGEINLEVQQGREAFALAKQGVLTDFSVGFTSLADTESTVDGDRVRSISKAILFEGSIVDEPMNPAAVITEVKNIKFHDLPLAPSSREWDEKAATERVREFLESNNVGEKAFLWPDELLIADIIDGRLTAVPQALFAAVKNLDGLPTEGKEAATRNIERYYAKMGLASPFDEKQYFVADDVKEWSERDVEKFLKRTGLMSKSAAKTLADRLDTKKKQDDNVDHKALRDLMNELKGFTKDLAK